MSNDMSNDIDHTITVQALGWDKRKGKSKTNVQNFE
jgi:hypothetical protein